MLQGTPDVEERILAAALKVVNENTVSGTRMHLIAAEAGLSQASLHYHFKTKKDLLVALLYYIQKDFSQQRKRCMEKQEDSLSGQLYGFFEQKRELIQEHPQLDRVQIDYWSLGQIDEEINLSFQESYHIWRKHIMDTVLLYAPQTDENKLQLLAGIMVSMMMGASLQYLNDPEVFGLDNYFMACEKMVELYLADDV